MENLKHFIVWFYANLSVALLTLALDVLVLASHHRWPWTWQGGLGLNGFGPDTAGLVNIPARIWYCRLVLTNQSEVIVRQRRLCVEDAYLS